MRLGPGLLVSLILLSPAAAEDDRRPQSAGKLQKEIHEAIRKGVLHLRKTQKDDGRWEYHPGRARRRRPGFLADADGGLTALALYAMAASGVPKDDDQIRKGLRWIRRNPRLFRAGATYPTYSASLLILALTRIDARAHRRTIHQLADDIVESQLPSRMWTYRFRGDPAWEKKAVLPHGSGDNSNSQFAVLALWAAERMAGYEAPRETWERIAALYQESQSATGGWGYGHRPVARAGPSSMTAAGLVSSVYAGAALAGGRAGLPAARRSKTAVRALGNFAVFPREPFERDYYFVYSLERVGTVMRLPGAEWYLPGARILVRSQKATGRWRPERWSHGDYRNVYHTAFALLFLVRATHAITEPTGDGGDSGGSGAATTARDMPDPAKPGNLARAFDYYRAHGSQDRKLLAPEFGRAGSAVLVFLYARLRAEEAAERRDAFELLDALMPDLFLFDPDGSAEDRATMLAPIERFLREHRARLRWDPVRRRFVLPPK